MFSIPVQIYYEDTDAGGVVYHARYLHFMERARTEFLRQYKVTAQSLKTSEGIIFVVKSLAIEYRKPALMDDLLTVSVQLKVLKNCSFICEQTIYRDDALLVSAQVEIVCLAEQQFNPVKIPPALREKIVVEN